MDKFWEWMKEKKYAVFTMDKRILLRDSDGWGFPEYTKQMIMGYMMEYLIDIHNFEGIPTTMCLGIEIDGIYKYLEKKIIIKK